MLPTQCKGEPFQRLPALVTERRADFFFFEHAGELFRRRPLFLVMSILVKSRQHVSYCNTPAVASE